MHRYGQRGAGFINHYEGPYSQKGSGFGSFFKGVVNFFRPLGKILKPIVSSPFVKDIGRDLISTGLDVATETIKGKPFKNSAKDNLRAAKKRVLSTIHKHSKPSTESDDDDQQSGGGLIKKMKFASPPGQPAAVKKKRGRRKGKKKTGGVRKKKGGRKKASFKKKKSKKKKSKKKTMNFKRTVFD